MTDVKFSLLLYGIRYYVLVVGTCEVSNMNFYDNRE